MTFLGIHHENLCGILVRYTIVTQVNGVSYGGWIPKEEEFEKTNFVKILQLT